MKTYCAECGKELEFVWTVQGVEQGELDVYLCEDCIAGYEKMGYEKGFNAGLNTNPEDL